VGAFLTLGCLAIFVCIYQSCAAAPGPNSVYSTSLGEKSVLVYTEKVEPILANQCARCHNSNVGPYFMTGNSRMNHDTLADFGLVTLGSPSYSKIVKKIRRGHEGIPIEFADEMQQAIALWAQGILPSEFTDKSILMTELKKPLSEYIKSAAENRGTKKYPMEPARVLAAAPRTNVNKKLPTHHPTLKNLAAKSKKTLLAKKTKSMRPH